MRSVAVVAVAVAACVCAFFGLRVSSAAEISPALVATYANKSTANIMVTMRDRPATIRAQVSAQSFANRGAKIMALRDSLLAHAQRSQTPVLELIAKSGPAASSVHVESFWISNQIYVRNAPLELVQALASESAVAKVEEERIITIGPPIDPKEGLPPQVGIKQAHAQWGVAMVRAPHVWESPEFGVNGTGVTVGIIDSGVMGTHEALRDNQANTGHSWLDPTDYTVAASDSNGHGTHCAGTILGTGSMGIGVAPGAQWIACKGLPNGQGSNAILIKCGEFMVCPTRPNGREEDCTLAPQIVSNSWGGGQGTDWYDDVIEAWHEAGIIPVFAIMNEGERGCESAWSPGDRPNVITVGATTASDSLASFSSLGPTVDGRRKPDITAPGHYIYSAGISPGGNSYIYDHGTSMATPHVSGVIALLLSYKPSLSFVDVKEILETSADHDLTFPHEVGVCGGIPNNLFPNNHFGHGRVNAYKAMVEASHDRYGTGGGGRQAAYPWLSMILLLAPATWRSFCKF